ncbi:MAG: radical SAM family heme chaperone HemW [Gammaproteobacteria bacterium]|nr:radical SAM family heme chaperone HemW [Gammaproteobacteria bacterium]MBT4494727.1 radical SAM family heme chaperone HemW [Gammaproteobacteria bacterium]
MNAIPLSLYVHFPWCVAKCSYCDFNSHALAGELPEAKYIDALIRDFDEEIDGEDRPYLTSIFFGGGTPSLFSSLAFDQLLHAIRGRFDISDTEVTIEANPGTFDQSNFEGYYDAGINRISIGAQSFSDLHLQKLGRFHQSDDITSAVSGAKYAGFNRINLDLMYGLPGQSAREALTDLERAITLEPDHLSWYQLTIEPNTYFFSNPPATPQDDTLAEIMDLGFSLLEQAGFRQYEVSAFARPGSEARHNLNYWQFGDYLGVGAGAHGKTSRDGKIIRTTKNRIPKDYLENRRRRETPVERDELALEFLMNALRLSDGFSFELFEERTGLSQQVLVPFLDQASDKGLISTKAKSVRTTQLGSRFLNELLLLIDMPDR